MSSNNGSSGWGWGGHGLWPGGAWMPTNISSCVLWLAADKITGLSDGDSVATWSDASGESNDATEATNKPTYETNVQNSLAVVRFNGSNDKLATASSLFTGADPRSIVVAFSHNGSSPYTYSIAGQGAVNATSTWFILQSRWNGVDGDPYLACYANDLAGTTAVSQGFKVCMVTYDGTDAFSYIGTTQENTGAKTLNTADVAFRLGCAGPGPGEWLAGDIGEVIVYSKALDAAERTLINDYLVDKWGL